MNLIIPQLLRRLRRGGDSLVAGRFVGRAYTRDVAFPFRMGAGFQGDVNRVHPCSIEPCLIDEAAPPTFYGQPVVVDTATNSVRALGVADEALTGVYGITVRPYPFQQQTGGMSSPFGGGTPPTSGVIDVLRSGYIMVFVNGVPTKNGPASVWTAASAGAHIQGGFEAVDPAGSGFVITTNNNTAFNGPPDSNGITELMFNI